MKTLTIRIDDDLHKKLKIHMIKNNSTIQDYVIELIKDNLDKGKKNLNTEK